MQQMKSKKFLIVSVVLLLSIICLVVFGGMLFLSFEGAIIVVGGTVINALLSYPHADVNRAYTAIKQLFQKSVDRRQGLHKDIMRMIMWSYVVQSQDLIGLEKQSARTAHDPLTRYGLDLVVSGYKADKIRKMMNTAAEAEFERRCAPVVILRNMAASAPAFGMVGTLIGMVMVMHNAGGDLSHIEGGLAVAMLATLYGLLLARLVCLPAADKLLQQEEGEHFRNYMITEGLTLLAEKQKPFYMQDRLNSFLEPAKHLQMDGYIQVAMTNRMALAA
jgi:chemotaxis protein MotA